MQAYDFAGTSSGASIARGTVKYTRRSHILLVILLPPVRLSSLMTIRVLV